MTYRSVQEDALNRHLPVEFLKKIYLLDHEYRPLNYISDSVNKLFKFIDVFNRRNRKILKKGIAAWAVTTKLKDNRITIWIADVGVKYTSKKHFESNTDGGAKIIFEYDCDTRKWVFKSFNYSGI